MAYAAVISLKQTMERLVNSCRFSLVSSTREVLESAYEEAASLQRVLKRLDDHGGGGGKRLDTLDDQIREAANKLEDFLELHQSGLFLDIVSEYDTVVLCLDSEQVRQEMGWFAETAKKLGEDYAAELDKPSPDDEGEGGGRGAPSSNADDMVGYSDELSAIKSHMTKAVRPDDWVAAVIFGRPGTGRSYEAWEVFQYVRREKPFECCVWATVGPTNHRKAILLGILSRILIIVNGDRGGDGRAVEIRQDDMMFEVSDEEYVRRSLFSILAGRRYMIVLDDVCDRGILEYLITVFPVQNNGSIVLVTTSALEVRGFPPLMFSWRCEDLTLQYEDMWWDVLRLFLFQSRPEMGEAGRKVVRNCRGRYICFAKLLLFLFKADRSLEAWNQIANDQHHPIFQEIVDEISEIGKIKEDFNKCTIEPASYRAAVSAFVEDGGVSIGIEFTKKKLFPDRFFPKMEVISFVGMTGIGKTAFVEKVFEYAQNAYDYDLNVRYFNHRVWVTLGPKYQSEDILIDILAQIFPVIGKMEIKGDVELARDLSQQLLNQRLFIVLDDVWSEAPLEHLKDSFPNIKGKALVTTRIGNVAHSEKINMVREMHLLSKEESWKLLCQKVFVEEDYCPRDLEKSGKKIAENCDGLPLTILKVANLISRDLRAEYWNDVAKKNSDFVSAVKEMSETLVPIYNSLPQNLKPCFLYMGVFSEICEVSTSKIFRLWIAEDFLEPNPSQRVEDFAEQCLLELVDRNLVMVCQKGSDHGVGTCRLNLVLWHLSNSEAARINFFHAFSNYDPDSFEAPKKQRRFCIRNCILFSIKDVHGAMMDSVSTAHSLVCTGAYHQYPVPVCWELRLLRMLDTLAIRLYDFPIQVVKLIHLRHLAITCDGDLPTTISKLWNLEFLIVSRHLRVASSSYLPLEIWDMKELRHVEVTGSNLPSPPTCTTILPNLVTLLDVGYHTCTEEVLRGIPNLQKLGIQIDLAPGDAPPFHQYLNRISRLNKLKSLKCVVANPEVEPEVVAPPAPLSMFPSSLEKLTLSGLGYPWEYMDIIGRLGNLKVLKLRGYAFQGHKWETGDNAFKKLQHLVIEDTDFVCWRTTVFSFSVLKHLSIKHCYILEEFPTTVFAQSQADTFEVVDCNPVTAKWEELIRERRGNVPLPEARERDVKLRMEFSWEVRGKPKFKR